MENKLIAKGTTTNLNSYTFNGIKDEPIIVINEDGFKYKGELIEDKGEIYQLLKNYLTSSQTEISDEQIEKWAKEQSKIEPTGAEEFGRIMGAKWYRKQIKQPKKD
jgi:hypothetical protein